MTAYQWLTLGLGAAGFLMTWGIGAGLFLFKGGRWVEQIQAALKEEIEAERDKLVEKMEELEAKFHDEQSTQDHRFGEVGAAMRQYMANVENKVREIEIWGRDHYVQKSDLTAIVSQLREDFRQAVGEIKDDIRQILSKQ